MTLIDPNNTQAILIGASEFDFFPNLPNVQDNLVKLRRLFIEVVGINRNKICLMLDKENPSDITSKIIDIIPNASDTIIVYYAGHGIPHLKKLYLATKKTQPKKPQYTGAICSKDLVDLVIQESKNVKNIIFIIDCCFSARAQVEVDNRGKQVFLITAAPSNQAAKDESPDNAYYTAFTHEFLNILKQGIENAGEILTLQEIINHLKKQLTDKDLPEPQFSAYGSPDKLGICQNRAYQHIVLTQNSRDIGKTALLSQKEIISFLVYLANRQPQKERLQKTIETYQHSNEKRPLLCLIHGNENEYGNFIKCLLNDTSPLNYKYFYQFFRKVKPININCSIENTCATVDELHQEILMRLVESKINAAPEKKAIAEKLAQKNQPVIVYTRIWTDHLKNWGDKQKTLIDGFIEFWADWPTIHAQRHLFLVFLSFHYQDKNHYQDKKSPVFSRIKDMFRRQKATDLMIQERFKTLDERFATITDSFKHKGIYAVVLPQLKSVEWLSIPAWIEDYEKYLKIFYHDTYALECQIKELLYKDNKPIPMDELAPKLKKIIFNPNN
jgi:hypothetical protein